MSFQGKTLSENAKTPHIFNEIHVHVSNMADDSESVCGVECAVLNDFIHSFCGHASSYTLSRYVIHC